MTWYWTNMFLLSETWSGWSAYSNPARCEVFLKSCNLPRSSYQGNSDEVGCYVAPRPLSKGNCYFEVSSGSSTGRHDHASHFPHHSFVSVLTYVSRKISRTCDCNIRSCPKVLTPPPLFFFFFPIQSCDSRFFNNNNSFPCVLTFRHFA